MRRARRLLTALLAAWALGLLLATLQLQAWQASLSGVLVQMQADALIRTHALQAGRGIEAPWYRRRALSLLAAVEQLHDEVAWTGVMPGSWYRFDDLQERVAHALGQAFGRIVVETVRRELEGRAAGLSGVAREARSGALDLSGGCQAPAGDTRARPASLQIDALAEYEALRVFLRETQRLDEAVTALRQLGGSAPAPPQALRALVRYTLGEDLSVPAARSLTLFQARPDAEDPYADALGRRLQAALQCSARLGLRALHTRLLGNALFESEDMLAHAMQPTLFAPVNEHDSPGSTLRLQAAVWLIEEQRDLLAAGDPAWLRGEDLSPEQEALLRHMAAIERLGPELATELRTQARAAQAQLAQAFRARFGTADSGLVWDPGQGRLVLSPRRQALHAGLRLLLAQPFMRADPDPTAATLGDIVALVGQRQHMAAQILPQLPPELRGEAASHGDARIGRLALARARRFVLAEAGRGAVQRLVELEAALAEAGAPAWGQALAQRLVPEVFSCADAGPHCLAPPEAPGPPWGNATAPSAPASTAD